MTPTADAWRTYHQWNRRTTRMAELWVRDLVNYLRDLPWLGPDRALLDFGCGFFDAGIALADRVGRVDGIDIEPTALEVARSRAAGTRCRFFGDCREVPRDTYDLIFASSVFQYLADEEEVLRTLRLFRTLLRHDGRREVLLVDLIPGRYSSVRDGLRSLWVATRHGVLAPMTAYLGRVALKGRGLPLLQLDPEQIAVLADTAGYDCERLPVNLTPSRQRYSVLLKRR